MENQYNNFEKFHNFYKKYSGFYHITSEKTKDASEYLKVSKDKSKLRNNLNNLLKLNFSDVNGSDIEEYFSKKENLDLLNSKLSEYTQRYNELIEFRDRELLKIFEIDDYKIQKKSILKGSSYEVYFWWEIKKKNYKNIPYSISFKVETEEPYNGLFLMLEIKNSDATKEQIKFFNSEIIKKALPGNEYFYIIHYKDKSKSDPIYNKVDLEQVLQNSTNKIDKIKIRVKINHTSQGEEIVTDKDVVNDIKIKFEKLIPIYEKLLSENDLEQSTIEIKNEEKNMENTNELPVQYPIQKILFGAPGTGKSYKIQSIIQKDIENYKDTDDNERVFRTTVHSEYTYFDFIGSILPQTKIDEETKQSEIKYEFTPGIFTLALEKALSTDEDENVYLIIEELSRGNIAAIFGDIFQLLDRDVDSGESSYHINNSQITEYLRGSEKLDWNKSKIYIPKNLNIIATMNTSDQNVNVVDTAFKRRFDFEYLSIDVPENAVQDINIFENVSWKEFNEVINDYIVNEMELSEDKQLGHYFVKFKKGVSLEQNQEVFKNKIMHYLWEDVQGASISDENKIFAEEYKSFSKLYSAFGTQKEKIFSKNILEKLGLSIDNNDESVDNNEKADVPQD